MIRGPEFHKNERSHKGVFFFGSNKVIYMLDLLLLTTIKAIKSTAAKASGVIAIVIKKSIAIKHRKPESLFI